MRALTVEELRKISGAGDDDGTGTITVTGNPTTTTTTGGTSTTTITGNTSTSDDDPGGDGDPENVPQVGIIVENEANREKVEEAQAKAQAAVNAIDAKIAALSDTAVVTFKDGSSYTGAEIKEHWENFSIVVSDRTFPTGSGAVENNVMEINAEDFLGWEAIGGDEFIILHDFAHASEHGMESMQNEWNEHLANNPGSPYDESDPDFIDNEQWANDAAKQLLDLLDLDPLPVTPTHGY